MASPDKSIGSSFLKASIEVTSNNFEASTSANKNKHYKPIKTSKWTMNCLINISRKINFPERKMENKSPYGKIKIDIDRDERIVTASAHSCFVYSFLVVTHLIDVSVVYKNNVVT